MRAVVVPTVLHTEPRVHGHRDRDAHRPLRTARGCSADAGHPAADSSCQVVTRNVHIIYRYIAV